MAKKTIQVLTDDLDGGNADETIQFAYRGTAYEIDLSAKNAAAFDEAMQHYVTAARRAAARRASPRRARSSANGRVAKAAAAASAPVSRDLAAIRTWAQKHGHVVSPKGRIATRVVEAYDKAHRRSG